MLEIKADGPNVEIRSEGPIFRQLAEFEVMFYSWAHKVAVDAETRDNLREIFVSVLTNDELWHIQPEKMETFVEVGDPEELFDPGGD